MELYEGSVREQRSCQHVQRNAQLSDLKSKVCPPLTVVEQGRMLRVNKLKENAPDGGVRTQVISAS